MSRHSRLPLLLTLGEPAGIGPNVVLLAHEKKPAAFKHVLLVAPAAWLRERARLLGGKTKIVEYADWQQATSCLDNASVLHCWNPGLSAGEVHPGKPSGATAEAVMACIRQAAECCLKGQARAMITAPIEKRVLREHGFDFPGHTEFLADLAACHSNSEAGFAMMLASSSLRVVLLTTHMAIRAVPDALSVSETLRVLRITHHDLQHRFAIDRPRLGMCALNPHAGEQGHFGDEEQRILQPAVDQARQLGINVSDPMPSDTLFSPQMREHYDAMICCYHDQGLIPLKTLSFGDAVNITLGLPFVRTSVDHGTACDRAGGRDVLYGSLLQAIHQARLATQSEGRSDSGPEAPPAGGSHTL